MRKIVWGLLQYKMHMLVMYMNVWQCETASVYQCISDVWQCEAGMWRGAVGFTTICDEAKPDPSSVRLWPGRPQSHTSHGWGRYADPYSVSRDGSRPCDCPVSPNSKVLQYTTIYSPIIYIAHTHHIPSGGIAGRRHYLVTPIWGQKFLADFIRPLFYHHCYQYYHCHHY